LFFLKIYFFKKKFKKYPFTDFKDPKTNRNRYTNLLISILRKNSDNLNKILVKNQEFLNYNKLGFHTIDDFLKLTELEP
jgi:hypothetical protein